MKSGSNSISATDRPWRTEKLPLIAGWLAANQRPLDLLVEASKRPRWYRPLIYDGGIFDSTILAPMNKLREAVVRQFPRHAATPRRQVRPGMGRLAGSAPFGPAGKSGTYPDRRPGRHHPGQHCLAADQALLQHAHSTAVQAAKIRTDLAALPPMAKMIDKLDVGERFWFSIP